MYIEISFFGFSASRTEAVRPPGSTCILDRSGQKDDALLQQARKNVVGALAAVGLLDTIGTSCM